jgi:hypothetical protein
MKYIPSLNHKIIAFLSFLVSISAFFLIKNYTTDPITVCLTQVFDEKEKVEDPFDPSGFSEETKTRTVRCWNKSPDSEVWSTYHQLKDKYPKNKYVVSKNIRTSLWSRHFVTLNPMIFTPISNTVSSLIKGIQTSYSQFSDSISHLSDSINIGISRDCRKLSILVLRSSFEDAPKNNGEYVSKVLTPNTVFYSYPGDTYKTFSRYVIGISNTGQISEGWWSSPRNNSGHMYRDYALDNRTPNFPEPVMKSNSGIVCNIPITTSQDSKNFLGEDVSNVIIWATGKNAVLSQDGNGYAVKY